MLTIRNNDGSYTLTVCENELRVINASLYHILRSALDVPELTREQEHFSSVAMKLYNDDLKPIIDEMKARHTEEDIQRCFDCAAVFMKEHPQRKEEDHVCGH